MERYLQDNPGVRWTLIVVLLLGILLEGLLISNPSLISGTTAGADPGIANGVTPTPAVLRCRVVGVTGVNLRRQPTTQVDNIITALPPETELEATARSGDVPWLQVRAGTLVGWVSTLDINRDPLVECVGDIEALPEGNTGATSNRPEVALARATGPAPTITAAPGEALRRGTGPELHVIPRPASLAVDGQLTEWGEATGVPLDNPLFRRENWQGAEDLSGTAYAAWDEQFLYLAVRVSDDKIVQESREDLLIRGDAVEFFWDLDLAGDFEEDRYNEDDAQMVFSPGNFAGQEPSAWVYRYPSAAEPRTFTLSATSLPDGYQLEVQLPWSALGVTMPQQGQVYGYALALSDDDSVGSGEQETQVAMTEALPYAHPAHWSNLVLQ